MEPVLNTNRLTIPEISKYATNFGTPFRQSVKPLKDMVRIKEEEDLLKANSKRTEDNDFEIEL